MTRIRLEGVSRRFNRRPIFQNVTLEVTDGQVFGITGRNGSGKSTLLKIIACLLEPSSGSVAWEIAGKKLVEEELHRHIGYVAPYLTLFEEFSASENIMHFARIRGIEVTPQSANALLERVGLPLDRHDPIRSFSSGMKQRMRLIFAILHNPSVLMLDEPTSNLDLEGDEIVWEIIREWGRDRIVLIASNEQAELAFCTNTFRIPSP